MTPTTKIGARQVVVVFGALVALSLAFATASAHGNNGTVKVKDGDSFGTPDNDPHVSCPFWIEGFDMAAASGNLTVRGWPPTGNGTVVLQANWTGDAGGEKAGYDFLNGPYSLPAGHYKLSVSNVHGHFKHKTFWIEECNVEIPFFPSGAALVVGISGAAGGALLLLRRRA